MIHTFQYIRGPDGTLPMDASALPPDTVRMPFDLPPGLYAIGLLYEPDPSRGA